MSYKSQKFNIRVHVIGPKNLTQNLSSHGGTSEQGFLSPFFFILMTRVAQTSDMEFNVITKVRNKPEIHKIMSSRSMNK